MTRIISAYEAQRLGKQLLDGCRKVRTEDLQSGRHDHDEAIAWLSSQVGSFALYIRVLSAESRGSVEVMNFVDQMVEESEKITRYMMTRVVYPDVPTRSCSVRHIEAKS